MIIVDLILAVICFTHNRINECHNALVGEQTPRGEYALIQRLTNDPGYGGDVLQFKETPDAVFAIHRVWLLKPKQNRLAKLKSNNAEARKSITGGCINIEPEVYDKLVNCCSDQKLQIR
jgi:hypothetical protein